PGAGARGDGGLAAVGLDVLLPGEGPLVRAEPRLRLRVAGARAGAHPLELPRECAAARRLRLLLVREALLLLLEPRGVVALERDAAAAVQLGGPPGDALWGGGGGRSDT